jgi:nitroreductase
MSATIIQRIKGKLSRTILKVLGRLGEASADAEMRLKRRWHVEQTLYEKLAARYDDDEERFVKAACVEAGGIYRGDCGVATDAAQLNALITMEYHRIEKCLVMPERRGGAGQDVVQRLMGGVREHLERFGGSAEVEVSLEALAVYAREMPRESLTEETLRLLEEAERMRSGDWRKCPGIEGGYLILEKRAVAKVGGEMAAEFFRRRHSIRDYTDQPVDREDVMKIMEIARTAPSVCNRQAWAVHVVETKEMVAAALALQNGNRGFGDRVPMVFVIAADLRAFVLIEERNQGWVDGGMFAMNVLHGIHAAGLGGCPLNWCASRENDEALRQLLGIPAHEAVIMMIALGHLPDSLRVARSTRREVADIVRFVS